MSGWRTMSIVSTSSALDMNAVSRAGQRLPLKPRRHGCALVGLCREPGQALDHLEGHQVGPGGAVAGLRPADDVWHVGRAHRATAGLQEGLAVLDGHGVAVAMRRRFSLSKAIPFRYWGTVMSEKVVQPRVRKNTPTLLLVSERSSWISAT